LLDAPCSASGIVRRHPDIRWLRRENDIGRLFETQSRLLKQLWTQLVPGGVLLYCTCSVFKDEGERQINSFLKHNSDAQLRPSPGHLIPQKTIKKPTLLDNQASDQDGFYYALLQKNVSL
jgi:16S rRNA (cytosine967-C5)-methyltransferase